MSHWKEAKAEIKRANKLLKGEEPEIPAPQTPAARGGASQKRQNRRSHKAITDYTDKEIAADIKNRIRIGIRRVNRGVKLVRVSVLSSRKGSC